MLIGLTGSVASGKSSVASFLKSLKYHVIDADKIISSMYEDNIEVLKIVKIFFSDALEGSVVSKEKILNNMIKKPLRFKLFICCLYKILLKKIINEYIEVAETKKIILLDAPTLFESGFNVYCDLIITVCAPLESRASRFYKKSLASRKSFYFLNSMQIPEKEKKMASNYSIINDSDFDSMFLQCKNIIQLIELNEYADCSKAKIMRDKINSWLNFY